jgi:DNA-directed RNA polymerase subunit RPC12/RpoP
MIHYSCDRCRRSIEPDEELRYSVSIKIEVTIDSSEFESEDERDHLVELNEILDRLDEAERDEISQSAYQRRRFDLCSDCHREYLKNPLALDAAAKLGFSEN